MNNITMSAQALCLNGVTEHPRYFPRQMISAVELTLEHSYLRDKLRRHNFFLHGWGVVCGADVCYVPNSEGDGRKPWHVKIKPGYILGPNGDEIVTCEQEVDLRKVCATGVSSKTIDISDPWCSDVLTECTGTLYLAIKYKEILARPVRVQPIGCGCDDAACEYSRWQDGYVIQVLTECPSSHSGDPPDLDFIASSALLCPPCPTDPWVVLAKIEVGDDGAIQDIDNFSCRRMVVSFGHLWYRGSAVRGAPSAETIAELDQLLDPTEAFEAIKAAGEWASVMELPATTLTGVTSSSRVGKILDSDDSWTIARIAQIEHTVFIQTMRAAIDSFSGTDEKLASDIWLRAKRVQELIKIV